MMIEDLPRVEQRGHAVPVSAGLSCGCMKLYHSGDVPPLVSFRVGETRVCYEHGFAEVICVTLV